jgi:hypothetical protein
MVISRCIVISGTRAREADTGLFDRVGGRIIKLNIYSSK